MTIQDKTNSYSHEQVAGNWDIMNAKHNFEITNHEIIALAYAHGELLGPVADGTKLTDAQASCYTTIFRIIEDLLKIVHPGYLKTHPRVIRFYNMQLMKDDDRLYLRPRPDVRI